MRRPFCGLAERLQTISRDFITGMGQAVIRDDFRDLAVMFPKIRDEFAFDKIDTRTGPIGNPKRGGKVLLKIDTHSFYRRHGGSSGKHNTYFNNHSKIYTGFWGYYADRQIMGLIATVYPQKQKQNGCCLSGNRLVEVKMVTCFHDLWHCQI
jgi:hypothetical protein